MERRLSVIMVADVVGFSRLMRANEVGTLRDLKKHESGLLEVKIDEYSGRVVKWTGDGFVAEFPSVFSATRCAAEIQTGMAHRNRQIPQDRRVVFRIGINAGDVIHDDGDVFGDGVNLAARIEAFAKPGGVALTGPTRDQIGDRADWVFEDAGDQVLKNFDQPVRLFHLKLDSERDSPGEIAGQSSIAVLPFVNMSGDADQEFFADGMTEDLITDLSKISSLFVVGRHSVFAHKGRSGNLIQIARELGVRYLLEGSVRKSGERIRITAQFIDGATGGHLWAERYDRDLNDIFALQDEISGAIVTQLKLKLRAQGAELSAKPRAPHPEAYSKYLKGRQLYHLRTARFIAEAQEMFQDAVDLDPGFAQAYAGIADCLSWTKSWFGSPVSIEAILETANKAIELQPELAEAHAAKGLALQSGGRSAEAHASLQRALDIDPVCYEAHYYFARYCLAHRDHETAAKHFIRALEIRPDDYRSPLLLDAVLKRLGRQSEQKEYLQLGLRRAESMLAVFPDVSDPLELGASVLAAAGEKELARKWLERGLLLQGDAAPPKYNIACAYVGLGELDLALDVLERVLMQAGPDAKQWIMADPDMDPIRDHPRFQDLIDGRSS